MIFIHLEYVLRIASHIKVEQKLSSQLKWRAHVMKNSYRDLQVNWRAFQNGKKEQIFIN